MKRGKEEDRVLWLCRFRFTPTSWDKMVWHKFTGTLINKNMEAWSTSSKPQSRIAAIAINLQTCAQEAVHERCLLSSTSLQSPELLSQCGFIWKETMQLLSGKVRFNPGGGGDLRNELEPFWAWKWGAPERAWAVLNLKMGGSGTSLIRF